jgi:murein tripeptide amidase MpaA
LAGIDIPLLHITNH